MLIVGRVQTILLAQGIGVLCQIMMALLPQLWPVTWVMVPVLLIKSGALHGGQLECHAAEPLPSQCYRVITASACFPLSLCPHLCTLLTDYICYGCRFHGCNLAAGKEHRDGHGPPL